MDSFIEIDKRIETLCKDDLWAIVQEYEKAEHERLVHWLREAADRLQNPVSGKRPVLTELLTDYYLRMVEPDRETPPESECLDALEQMAGTLPEELLLVQEEERFQPAETDSVMIRTAKGGKRLLRSIVRGYRWLRAKVGLKSEVPPFRQRIPLAAVARYHLTEDEKIARQLSDSWNRYRLLLLAEMESLLTELVTGEIANTQTAVKPIAAFLREKQSEADAQHKAHCDRWEQHLDRLQESIRMQAHRVGTLERRDSYYRAARVRKTVEIMQGAVANRSQRWRDAREAVGDKLNLLTRFFGLRSDLIDATGQLTDDLIRMTDEHIFNPADTVITQIRKAEEVSRQGDPEQIAGQGQTLPELVREKLVEPLARILEEGAIEHMLEQQAERLLWRSNAQPEQVRFYFNPSWEEYPPRFEERELPWQVIVTRRLNNRVLNGLREHKSKLRSMLEDTLTDFRELEEVIRVNLREANRAEGEESPESVEEVAGEGLQRALAKLSGDLDPLKQHRDELISQLKEATDAFVISIGELLTAEDPGDLKALDTRFRVRETTSDLNEELRSRSSRWRDKVLVLVRFAWKKLRVYYRQSAQFLGFRSESVASEAQADIATYLTETDRRLQELPFIYRKLFRLDAELERRFFVPPLESFGRFRKAMEMWMEGFGASCAVIGEKGSGKSTFIQLALDEAEGNYDLHRIELNRTIWTEEQLLDQFARHLDWKAENLQELIERLNAGERKTMIVIENIQNAYLRSINGYEALSALLLTISETRGSVFWFAGCSRYAWNLLAQIESADEYFSHIVEADTLDRSQIETVIMRRHKVSGFELHFEADEETTQLRAFRKLADDPDAVQQYLEERYFRRLAELCGGNASIALIFWIRSIRDYTDTHFTIEPLEVASVEMLDELKPQVLFTLAALILHDSLSASELERVLNIDHRQSRLVLARLEAKGVLKRNGDTYMLNHLMYRQVVNMLKQRNILHLA